MNETPTDTPLVDSPVANASTQPMETVTRDGVTYTILGTAHVSKASADAVQSFIDEGDFDAVAIELDRNRYNNLTNPDALAELDLFQVIRSGRAGMVAANLALSAFQQRVAEQFDIEPGQEMRVAIKAANEADLPLLLVDRDIGVTLNRVYRSVPWWQRFTLMAGIVASLFSNEEVTEEEIEKLKEGDMLEATFTEFAESSEKLYTPLIAERDAYMAAKLREGTRTVRDSEAPHYENVLVVIGAGSPQRVDDEFARLATRHPSRYGLGSRPSPKPASYPSSSPGLSWVSFWSVSSSASCVAPT